MRDAFAVERGCVRVPMHAKEVEPLMALADDPDAGMEDVAEFTAKWGVSLDWPPLGDVRGLGVPLRRRSNTL